MKIELGGGHNPVSDDVINIDMLPTADLILDLEEAELPYPTGSVDIVYAHHTLEHIKNLIPLMNECHRVLKPNGRFEIVVPLFPSTGAMKDPTHIRFFVPESFDYFDKDWDYPKQPDYGITKWTVLSKTIDIGDPDYATLKVELQK